MDQLLQFELTINIFFQNLGTWLKPLATGLSFLGTESFFILALPAIYWCIDSGIGFRVGIMLVATTSLNGYLKILFHSPRPFWVDPKVKAYSTETSFGLPSGHSQTAASMWGLAVVKFKKNWLTVISIASVLLIGLSRIYLGMHFTRDVLSGWLIGGFLVVLFILLDKPFSKWIGSKSFEFQILLTFLLSVLIISLGYASVAATSQWVMPDEWGKQSLASIGVAPDPFSLEGCYTIGGVLFGFVSGYAWMLKRKEKMVVSGSISSRIIRYFIGLTGLLALYLGLKLILPESPVWLGLGLRFIRYAMIGLWVSAIAPILFKKLKLN